MPYYFTYGPCIHPDIMRQEIGEFPLPFKGYLPDYKLTFSLFRPEIRSGVVDIVLSEGNRVYGMVYDLTVPQIDQLTRKEKGYHLTTRKVRFLNGNVVLSYLLVVQQRQGYISPTKKYIDELRKAMASQGFGGDVIERQFEYVEN